MTFAIVEQHDFIEDFNYAIHVYRVMPTVVSGGRSRLPLKVADCRTLLPDQHFHGLRDRGHKKTWLRYSCACSHGMRRYVGLHNGIVEAVVQASENCIQRFYRVRGVRCTATEKAKVRRTIVSLYVYI